MLLVVLGSVSGALAGTLIDSALNYSKEIETQSRALKLKSPQFLKRDAEQLTQQTGKLVTSLEKYRSNVASSRIKQVINVLADQWSEFGDWRDALQDERGNQLENTLEELETEKDFDDRDQDLQSFVSGADSFHNLERRTQMIDRSLERINQALFQDIFQQIAEIYPEHRTRIARNSLQVLFKNYVEDLHQDWELRKISGPAYLSLVEQYFDKIRNDSDTDLFTEREFGYLLKDQGKQLLSASSSKDRAGGQLARLNQIVARLLPGEQQDGPFGALR